MVAYLGAYGELRTLVYLLELPRITNKYLYRQKL